MTDHEAQLCLAGFLFRGGTGLGLHLLEPRLRRRHASLEGIPLQESFLVHLGQPGDPSLQPEDLRVDRPTIPVAWLGRVLEPAAVFALDSAGFQEQPMNILPYRFVERTHAD